MIPWGLSQATTIRIGHEIGSKQHYRILSIFHASSIMVMFVSSLSAFVFLIYPDELISISASAPDRTEIVTLASHFLRIAAAFQFLDAVQTLANGGLRGLKDTFTPMLIGLLTFWGIGISSGAWFAFGTSLGSSGIWWGIVLGLGFAAVLLMGRWYWKVSQNKWCISSVD